MEQRTKWKEGREKDRKGQEDRAETRRSRMNSRIGRETEEPASSSEKQRHTAFHEFQGRDEIHSKMAS